MNPSIAIVATGVAAVGFLVAWRLYGGAGLDRAQAVRTRFAPVHDLLWNKYYIDDFYLFLVRQVQQGIAVVANFIEQKIIIGLFVKASPRARRTPASGCGACRRAASTPT